VQPKKKKKKKKERKKENGIGHNICNPSYLGGID
jgi:hypothetical protein